MEAPANSPSRSPPESASITATTLRPSSFPRDPYPRLSLSPPARITIGSLVSAIVGFSLGATQGGQTAQLRFRAEHAHKMPDSTAGWYLYHKSKNYHVMFGGLREGFRMASRTGAWTLMALSLESTVDRCRGTSDLFSTIIASLTVAGAFSLWSKCKMFATSVRNLGFIVCVKGRSVVMHRKCVIFPSFVLPLGSSNAIPGIRILFQPLG